VGTLVDVTIIDGTYPLLAAVGIVGTYGEILVTLSVIAVGTGDIEAILSVIAPSGRRLGWLLDRGNIDCWSRIRITGRTDVDRDIVREGRRNVVPTTGVT
jgi:hypothetical protein